MLLQELPPFSNLLGHKRIASYLLKIVELGRFPAVTLFTGPAGVGKRTFALEFASRMIGGIGNSYERAMNKNHPDLCWIAPSSKSGMHLIEEIRSALVEAGKPPFEASRKVFIIEECHDMTVEAANTLLKTLEEPLPGVHFILTSSQEEKLLDTIVSRSQVFKFPPLAENDLIAFIERAGEISHEEAAHYALLAEGSLQRVKELLGRKGEKKKGKGELAHDLILEILAQQLYLHPTHLLSSLTSLDEIFGGDKEDEDVYEGIDPLLETIAFWFRDLELLNIGADRRFLYHREQLEDLKRSLVIPRPPLEKILLALGDVKRATLHNIKPKSALERFFLSLV